MTASATTTEALVAQLADMLIERALMLATAESCTGGLIAGACTDRAGSSAWFDRGFVTYSNAAKQSMLGVPALTLDHFGAVSRETAEAMVAGALAHSDAGMALAVTGVAGPGGGSPDKPVGTVWFGWGLGPTVTGEDTLLRSECVRFDGDRAAVRVQTVRHALAGALALLGAAGAAAPGVDPGA